MDISKTLKDDTTAIFYNYVTKRNANKITKGIVEFSINYANINETPFLLDSIFNTKVNEIEELFKKSNFLKNAIKKKIFTPMQICYLKPEELDPEKYKDIIQKKKLEEYKKNNIATSNAFTCKKCNASKCLISQRQTRRGDEPATVYITCTECDFSFKI